MGWLLLDKLGHTLKGIPDHEARSFLVGAPSAIVSSSLDNIYTIRTQDHKPSHGMLFLGAAIKLHMRSLT